MTRRGALGLRLVLLALPALALLAACNGDADEPPGTALPASPPASSDTATLTPPAVAPATPTAGGAAGATPVAPGLPRTPGPDAPVSATPGAPRPGTPAPTSTPRANEREEPAPIERVVIRVAESFPPQYFVDIVSALPNGCHRFGRIELQRSGETIAIAVINYLPRDPRVACTLIYGTVEHHIALGSNFVSGRTYTVRVNDVTRTFVAQ